MHYFLENKGVIIGVNEESVKSDSHTTHVDLVGAVTHRSTAELRSQPRRIHGVPALRASAKACYTSIRHANLRRDMCQVGHKA